MRNKIVLLIGIVVTSFAIPIYASASSTNNDTKNYYRKVLSDTVVVMTVPINDTDSILYMFFPNEYYQVEKKNIGNIWIDTVYAKTDGTKVTSDEVGSGNNRRNLAILQYDDNNFEINPENLPIDSSYKDNQLSYQIEIRRDTILKADTLNIIFFNRTKKNQYVLLINQTDNIFIDTCRIDSNWTRKPYSFPVNSSLILPDSTKVNKSIEDITFRLSPIGKLSTWVHGRDVKIVYVSQQSDLTVITPWHERLYKKILDYIQLIRDVIRSDNWMAWIAIGSISIIVILMSLYFSTQRECFSSKWHAIKERIFSKKEVEGGEGNEGDKETTSEAQGQSNSNEDSHSPSTGNTETNDLVDQPETATYTQEEVNKKINEEIKNAKRDVVCQLIDEYNSIITKGKKSKKDTSSEKFQEIKVPEDFEQGIENFKAEMTRLYDEIITQEAKINNLENAKQNLLTNKENDIKTAEIGLITDVTKDINTVIKSIQSRQKIDDATKNIQTLKIPNKNVGEDAIATHKHAIEEAIRGIAASLNAAIGQRDDIQSQLTDANNSVKQLKTDMQLYLGTLSSATFAQSYAQLISQLLTKSNEVVSTTNKQIGRASKPQLLRDAIAKFQRATLSIKMDNFYTDVAMLDKGGFMFNTRSLAKDASKKQDLYGLTKRYFFDNYLGKYIKAITILLETLIAIDKLGEKEISTSQFKDYKRDIEGIIQSLEINVETVHLFDKIGERLDVGTEMGDYGLEYGTIVAIDDCRVYLKGETPPATKILVKTQG